MSQVRQTSGWTSPSQPSGAPPIDTAAHRPGCRNGSAVGSKASGGQPSPAASASSTPFRAKKSTGSPPPRQDSRHQRADRERAVAVRLGDRGRRCRRGSCPASGPPALRRRAAQVDGAGLEQRDRLPPPREVARGDVEQRAEQGRPHRRALVGERVGDQDRVGARVGLLDPEARRLAGVGEAPADDLVEAEVPQLVLGPPPQPLGPVQAADLASPTARQRRRQVAVEAVEAPDLLDQVDLPGHVVVAVGRHRHLEVLAVGLDPEAEPLQVGDLVGLRDLHAEDARPPGRRAAAASAAAAPGAATSIVPGTSVAPQSSTISCEATAWARRVRSGCSCFSKRAEASERSASRREVCSMLVPVPVRRLEQHARSSRRRPRRPGRPSARRSRSAARDRRRARSRRRAPARRRRASSSSPPRCAVRTISSPPGTLSRS